MSSYLRPRRGKKSTAIAQLTSSNPLKRGEIFFEVPDNGVGTGAGKLKMGDGVTAYANLPYFVENLPVDTALNANSMNPIANKPVAEAITQLNNDLDGKLNLSDYDENVSVRAIADSGRGVFEASNINGNVLQMIADFSNNRFKFSHIDSNNVWRPIFAGIFPPKEVSEYTNANYIASAGTYITNTTTIGVKDYGILLHLCTQDGYGGWHFQITLSTGGVLKYRTNYDATAQTFDSNWSAWKTVTAS